MTQSRRLAFAALPLLLVLGGGAAAQPFGGPGMMMMDPGFGPGSARMCRFGSRAFAVADTNRAALELRLDEAQRAAYAAYADSASKATETMRAACPASPPRTVPAQMQAMEARAAAMLAAVTTVRPTLDAFYASLSDAQKARFDSRSGRWRFWHMREAW